MVAQDSADREGQAAPREGADGRPRSIAWRDAFGARLRGARGRRCSAGCQDRPAGSTRSPAVSIAAGIAVARGRAVSSPALVSEPETWI